VIEWAGGLFASELVERLSEYNKEDGREIVLRKLQLKHASVERVALETQLEDFVRKLMQDGMGSNRAMPIGQAIRAARKQVVRGPLFAPSKGTIARDDMKSLFCSKTVALCYKHVGLIPQHRGASDVLPKHFSSKYDYFLALQDGASLGPELPLSFEPAAVHDFTVYLLSLADPRNGSAIRIQMAFRRWQHYKQVSARRATLVRWLLGGLCAAATSCLASMSVDVSPAKRRASQPTLLEQEVREETGQVLRAVHAESTSKPRAADYGEAHWEAMKCADMV